jgi:hypothetical protein
MSLKDLRRYLTERREALVTASSERSAISRDEAGRTLDRISTALALFDWLELEQRREPGSFTLTLRLLPPRPLP